MRRSWSRRRGDQSESPHRQARRRAEHVRRFPGRADLHALTNLYNQRPTWLDLVLCSVILCSLLAALLAGCSLLSPTPDVLKSRPDDLQVVYEWREGSLPPPYHYEVTISIEPDGQGQIVMIPDYPSEDVPTWTETFQVSQSELDGLYKVLVEQGLFMRDWRAEDSPPVGGSSQSMVVTAHGRTISIPSYVVPAQDSAAEAIFSAVNAAVPQAIWDKLNAQREEYVQEH